MMHVDDVDGDLLRAGGETVVLLPFYASFAVSYDGFLLFNSQPIVYFFHYEALFLASSFPWLASSLIHERRGFDVIKL